MKIEDMHAINVGLKLTATKSSHCIRRTVREYDNTRDFDHAISLRGMGFQRQSFCQASSNLFVIH